MRTAAVIIVLSAFLSQDGRAQDQSALEGLALSTLQQASGAGGTPPASSAPTPIPPASAGVTAAATPPPVTGAPTPVSTPRSTALTSWDLLAQHNAKAKGQRLASRAPITIAAPTPRSFAPSSAPPPSSSNVAQGADDTEPVLNARWVLILTAALLGWYPLVTFARLIILPVGRLFGVVGPATGALLIRLSIVGVLWRPPYAHLWVPFLWWRRQVRLSTGANAGWASPFMVQTQYFRPGGDDVPLGRFVWKGIKGFQTIAYRGPLHVNFVGPAGSGKTSSFVSWLGTLPPKAATFYIDCDAEITRTLGDTFTSDGHKVVCLDPNHLAPARFRGHWNALDELTAAEKRHGREAVANFAKALGEGLVRDENCQQEIFSNLARDFCVALVLYTWIAAEKPKKTLVHVRHLLCCGIADPAGQSDPFQNLLSEMMKMADADDGCGDKLGALIARGAAAMRSGENKNGNPFRTAAMRATSWIDLPGMAEICQGGDPSRAFVCEDLKTSSLCVGFVAPLTDIQTTYSGFTRALSVMIAQAFQNMPWRLKVPCVMLLDEANSLGRLSLIETGCTGFRRLGIRLALGFHDLPAIQAAYPGTYRSIIGNAGVTAWIGVTENDTLRYIAETLGSHTRREKVEGTPRWMFWVPRALRIPARYQNFERPLKDPLQVKDTLMSARGMMIVTGKGRPFIAALDPYWTALSVWRYSANPSYPETMLRSLTRQLLGRQAPPTDQQLSQSHSPRPLPYHS